MSEERLPAHVEVSGLLRRVQAEGGFAMVLAKGERDAGTLMVVIGPGGGAQRTYERMPQADGTRAWTCVKACDSEHGEELANYLNRRKSQDRDLWIVELDVANGERFIGLPVSPG